VFIGEVKVNISPGLNNAELIIKMVNFIIKD